MLKNKNYENKNQNFSNIKSNINSVTTNSLATKDSRNIVDPLSDRDPPSDNSFQKCYRPCVRGNIDKDSLEILNTINSIEISKIDEFLVNEHQHIIDHCNIRCNNI